MSKTKEEWKAYIVEQAALFKGPEWAPSADRGLHRGGYNENIPWPDHQPRWMVFDYILNSHVIVTIGNHFNYWVDDPTALDSISQYAVEAEADALNEECVGLRNVLTILAVTTVGAEAHGAGWTRAECRLCGAVAMAKEPIVQHAPMCALAAAR